MHNKIQENTIDNRILNESHKGYEKQKDFLILSYPWCFFLFYLCLWLW